MNLFISYARYDKQWIYDFIRGLETRVRATVWHDRDIIAGQHWWDEILKQIEICDCAVVILTPAYITSIYCMAELNYALALNKPIIPILMKKCDVPPLLQKIQYLSIENRELADILLDFAVTWNTINTSILRGDYTIPANKPVRPLLPRATNSGVNINVHAPEAFDDASYRRWLRKQTEHIDIRGIGAGNVRQVHRFSLLSLYIPLHARKTKHQRGMLSNQSTGDMRISLHDTVETQRYTLIIGHPGSGKTTFLNYLARIWVDQDKLLPLLMNASEVYDYVSKASKYHDGLTWKWLIEYWCLRSDLFGWDFSPPTLSKLLEDGKVALLLDGLDELPDHEARVKITRMIDSSVQKWHECKWVIASRPGVLHDKARPLDFIETTIDSLSDQEISDFIRAWVNLLFQQDGASSVDGEHGHSYERELLATIRDRRDVNFLAHNPVMLTSMVVVHWNEKKLPEGKADLYEAVIRWLLKTRDHNYSQFENQKVRQRFQHLALAMFCHADGRRTTVGRQWAAAQLAAYFDKDEPENIALALQFLDQGEIDTGIIARRDEGNLTFWHASFQEYLAACEIASKTDDEQAGWWSIIEPHLFDPAWREVLRFVPVILHRLGDERVDLFIKRALKTRRDDSLAEMARVVGFLGLILYDLSVYGYSVKHMQEYVQARDQVMQIFKIEDEQLLNFASRYDAAIALGRSGDPRLFDTKANFVTIESGSASIGAQNNDPAQPHYDEFADAVEQPCHVVYSATFQIGRYPVTVQEFLLFIEDGGYQRNALWDRAGWRWRTRLDIVTPSHWDEQVLNPNLPVVYLSWHEAYAYCNWLSSRDDDLNYRLPTEAEWEYMARRGQSTYQRYVFGNVSPAQLTAEINWHRDVLAPVGMFPRDVTADGVMDINGNIYEWVYDQGLTLYSEGTFQANVLNEPTTHDTIPNFRTRRGGSWDDISRNHRTASRNAVLSSNRYDDTGFRVLCTRKPIPILV